MICLMIRLQLCKRDYRDKVPFLAKDVLYPQFSYCTIWKEFTIYRSHLNNELCSTFSIMECSHNLFGIFLPGILVSHLLPHLFIQSSNCISMDRWIFILCFGLGPNTILLFFLVQNVPAFCHWKLFQLVPLSLFIYSYRHGFLFVFCFVLLFSTLWHCKMFQDHLVDFLFSPWIRHFSRSSVTFCWRMILETKIWAWCVLCFWSIIFPRA